MVNGSPRCHTNSLCWAYLHLGLLCPSWMMRTPSFLTSCRRLWSTCSTGGRNWRVKRETFPVVSQHMHCISFQNIALQHSSCTLKHIRAFLENWLHKVWNCEKLRLFLVYCRFLFYINTQNMGRTRSGGSGMCTIVYLSECLGPFVFLPFFSNQTAAPSARSSPRLLCAFSWR